MIAKTIERAQQECEAGFPVWRRIPVRLQLQLLSSDQAPASTTLGSSDASRLMNASVDSELFLFNPESARGFTLAAAVHKDVPLARLSRATFMHILDSKLCAQQAFVRGELRISGELESALHFSRLFIELTRIANEMAEE